MNSSSAAIKYVLLYLPWLVSLLFVSDPIASYLIAWSGSFYIFYLSFTNKIKATWQDTPLSEKILRPLFLMQIIFAGYMCCTSIFYFLDNLGYEYATKIIYKTVNKDRITYIASCQRDYLLGHAALVHGLLLRYKSAELRVKFAVFSRNWALLFVKIAIVCLPLSILFARISGLSQFSEQTQSLSFVAATLALSVSIQERRISIIILAGSFFSLNLAKALLSGFKEPVIVSVLILGIFLYPYYKRTVAVLFIPTLFLLFLVLPTYVNIIRQMNWNGKASPETAQKEAFNRVRKDISGKNMNRTTWEFLTGRLSEISMFIDYKKSLQRRKVSYGFQIATQAFSLIVPRFLWPAKPSPEKIVLERVYENGIIERTSNNSAKPAVVVDAYLSGGELGVWVTFLLYGILAQAINNKCEELFGGYLLGTALTFTALFQVFWRGNCFEFLFNTVFWSYVSLYFLFFVLRKYNIINKAHKEEETIEASTSLQIT